MIGLGTGCAIAGNTQLTGWFFFEYYSSEVSIGGRVVVAEWFGLLELLVTPAKVGRLMAGAAAVACRYEVRTTGDGTGSLRTRGH